MIKLAQQSVPLYPKDNKLHGQGDLGLQTKAPIESVQVLIDTLSLIIGAITVVAFIYFLFLILIGGISWMTAGGDKTKVAEAASKMTYGLIGMVIIISAIFIVDLVAQLFGYDAQNIGMEIMTRFNF